VPDAPRVHVGAMEGKGAYNRNAAMPASGAALAIPLLEKAAQQIRFDSDDRPIVIADYGSSQGKNSLAPMRAAVAALRMGAGRQRPIFVCHTDLPANDFSEMLRCSRATRKAICKANRRFFHMRSAARFIGACSRPATSISDGVHTLPSGSARFLRRSRTTPSFPARPARSGPSSIARRHETGKHS
jgi:SAM dependent carboxyl methyltransferase